MMFHGTKLKQYVQTLLLFLPKALTHIRNVPTLLLWTYVKCILLVTHDQYYLLDMTKLYGYDRNDDGVMLNKRIY